MKNENLKRIANIVLITGIVLALIGAMYIAIVQRGYAIAACFVLASALMASLLASSAEKKSTDSDQPGC